MNIESIFETAKLDFQRDESVDLPFEVNYWINQCAMDSGLRAAGNDPAVWSALSKCLNNPSNTRYLMGLTAVSRVLVTSKGAGKLAWGIAGRQACQLMLRLASQRTRERAEHTLFMQLIQFIANMAGECQDSNTPVPIIDELKDISPDAVSELCRLLAEEKEALGVLVLLKAATGMDPGHNLIFYLTSGKPLFLAILTHVERYFASPIDHYATILTSIFTQIVQCHYAPSFVKEFADIDQNQKLSFLKLVDATLNSTNEIPEQVALARLYVNELEMAAQKALPFISAADTGPQYSQPIRIEMETIWNTLVVVLDTLNVLLGHDKKLSGTAEAVQTVKDTSPLVRGLIELLGEAHNCLPQRKKLSEIGHNEELDLNHEDFPLIKVKIISLLTLLVQGDKQVQDEMRERKGLQVVLSNCIIDANNPFIKEQCILCIRYLLANNAENQQLVADLEAKQAVDGQTLDKAGYETEITDGKIKIKKK